MNTLEITDPLFREAVGAIDSGNVSVLRRLLEKNPQVVRRRLDVPEEGYFRHPYLLWFVAGNPVRSERLPANIADIARLLVSFVRRHAGDSFQEQIDYTLGLVETGRVPRESGVQIELIDVLIDGGATPGNAHGALAHGNVEAAQHIIERSGRITLAAAACLDRIDDVKRMLAEATIEDRQVALIAAALYGKAYIIELLIRSGVDVNAHIDSGFHTHASALHQAVQSGSLEAVKLLVEAGADRDASDTVYHGTPLGWAMYMQTEKIGESATKKYAEIENYLRNRHA